MNGPGAPKKYIAVLLQNFVQFYAVKPFIDNYKKAEIHLFVPQCQTNDSTYIMMYDKIYSFLKENYRNVYRESQSCNYDILMEPYPITFFNDLKCKKRVKYRYSVNSAKPSPVYRPEHNYNYDVILCHSSYEQKILAAYANTKLVEKLNYVNFNKKQTRHAKKRILYAPTFGDLSSINEKLLSEFSKLKTDYELIAKIHHATVDCQEGSRQREIFEQTFAKNYDERTPLCDILEQVDAVITDNSGTIFEALYTETPIATFSTLKSNRDYNGISPLQDMLRQDGIIPYTDKVEELPVLIKKVLAEKNKKQQKEYSQTLFPFNNRFGTESFFKTIDTLLYDDNLTEKNYYILKHSMAAYIDGLNAKNISLQIENQAIKDDNKELKELLKKNQSKIINKLRHLISTRKKVKK